MSNTENTTPENTIENTNLVLDVGLEVSQRPTVRQMDQINLVYKKYAREEIWEIQMCLDMISILLIDKTKTQEIQSVLDSELDEEMMTKISKWWDMILPIVTRFENNAKKK